jgi:hypothetical protein
MIRVGTARSDLALFAISPCLFSWATNTVGIRVWNVVIRFPLLLMESCRIVVLTDIIGVCSRFLGGRFCSCYTIHHDL